MAEVISFPAISTPRPSTSRELRRPARPGLLARLRMRLARRRMLRDELLPEPDSVLADAGWTREDALREARKPLWKA